MKGTDRWQKKEVEARDSEQRSQDRRLRSPGGGNKKNNQQEREGYGRRINVSAEGCERSGSRGDYNYCRDVTKKLSTGNCFPHNLIPACPLACAKTQHDRRTSALSNGVIQPPTCTIGRRSGSFSAWRKTSCVTGAVSPSPNAMYFIK